jgi:hypothetical protein
MDFSGAANAVDGTFNIPGGYAITSDTGGSPYSGSGWIRDASAGTFTAAGTNYRNSGAVNIIHTLNNGGNGGIVRESQPIILASGDAIEVLFAVPISGWNSTLL